MLRALRGYKGLQVTMLLVVNHLLVKAVDFLAIDLTLINCFNTCTITLQLTGISCLALLFLSHVWVYNKQTNYLCVYKRLLTNHFHGKAAELCLANS